MFGYRHGKGAVVLDGKHVADTLQCVHCGGHWELKMGSGAKRGFCPSCNGVVCGQKDCMSHCAPFEARVELTEHIATGNLKAASILREKYPGIVAY